MNKQRFLNLGRIFKDTKLFCDQMGKQHRRPFKNTESRDIMLEKLIYTDVGSCRTSQQRRTSRFYIIFKDDASSFTHTYFLRHKSDVFEKFKEYYALITNKFNRSIKAIRMDNGKENINNMKSFLMFQEVQLEMTVPYTPTKWLFRKAQQNTIREGSYQCYMPKSYHFDCRPRP